MRFLATVYQTVRPIGPLSSVLSVCDVCVFCQPVGWIKMPLGMEIGLRAGHIVLDGDSALSQRGAQQPPQFSAHVYCGHIGWMD